MKVTVDLDVDKIVREELVEAALVVLQEDYDVHENLAVKAKLFSSLCVVVEFYSTTEQWAEFLEKINNGKIE